MYKNFSASLIDVSSIRSSIKSLLSMLTELQKKIIILKFFLNYSDIEIANELCKSRQVVNRIKNRALKRLRENIGGRVI